MVRMVRVNPAFAELIPPLTPEEYAGLERSILEEGVREPIIVWTEYVKTGPYDENLSMYPTCPVTWIVDGHNRYKIATKYGLDFDTVEYDFDDENEVKLWMIDNQLSRRNLPDIDRILLEQQRASIVREEAKAKQSAAGGDRRSEEYRKTASVQMDKSGEHIDTRAEIAKKANVSMGSVARVEQIQKYKPELIEKIRSGEETIGGAYKKVVREKREASREAKRESNAEQVKQLETPLDAMGLFSTIVIDPPWDWGDEGDVNQMGRAKPDYATMPVDELEKLPIDRIAADDAHLYLWVTNRSLPKAFRLMESWGFRYITCITWVKPSFGMGNYFRGQTEQLLFGVRGSMLLKRKDAPTVLFAERGAGGHSSKPDEAYEFVESCSPGPYIDVFGRADRDGWSVWGQES